MITFISITSSLAINPTTIMAYMQGQGQGQEDVQQQQQQQQQQQFVEPTLCISRTHKNIRQERVFAVLRQLRLGWVGKIDMVPKKVIEKNPDGTASTKEFTRVFIHFTKWFTDNRQTQQFLDRLDSQGFVHIIYDEPWYWKVTRYFPRDPKPLPQSRYPRPRIDFGVGAVQKPTETNDSSLSSSSTAAAPIIPVQVTRHLQSVSVSGGSESKNKYWKQQAEIVAATAMCNHYSASPTPRSRGSDSESSPSPVIARNVSVRLFD
jgi:hypothetical protein